MPRLNSPGSGTLAIDYYREGMANAAINVLSAGGSVLCRSTDHSGAGELCIETINRFRNDPSKRGSGLTEAAKVPQAIINLTAGIGHHLAQGAHTGANTCAQVIAAQLT